MMIFPPTKPLQSEQDYFDALARLERIFPTAQRGSPEGDEFELLSLLITDWEHRNIVIERPKDPIGLIRFAMESRGMKIADLAPVMPRNRASEILNKKRPLTLAMIRWFHENLHLSLESLTQPYSLNIKKAG